MINNSTFAENIAKTMILQNQTILDCIAYPEKYKPKPGPSFDAYGNPGYVDSNGVFRKLEPKYDFNGWTV